VPHPAEYHWSSYRVHAQGEVSPLLSPHVQYLARIDTIQKKGAMRSVDIAHLLVTRPETVSRWNQDNAFPRPDTQKLLLDLEYIIDELSDLYEPQDLRFLSMGTRKAKSSVPTGG
jgi:hypothetical protein